MQYGRLQPEYLLRSIWYHFAARVDQTGEGYRIYNEWTRLFVAKPQHFYRTGPKRHTAPYSGLFSRRPCFPRGKKAYRPLKKQNGVATIPSRQVCLASVQIISNDSSYQWQRMRLSQVSLYQLQYTFCGEMVYNERFDESVTGGMDNGGRFGDTRRYAYHIGDGLQAFQIQHDNLKFNADAFV